MMGIDVRIFLINTSEEVLGHSFACIYWKYLNYSLNALNFAKAGAEWER